MKTYFEATVQYAQENEQGLLKNVSQKYLLDATSHTEAEAIIYQKLGSFIRGDFHVKRLVPANITDVFIHEESHIFHKCKITYIIADADSGKEKKVTQYMLVTADDVKQAYDRIQENISNMLVSFRVHSITESPIVEFFNYER